MMIFFFPAKKVTKPFFEIIDPAVAFATFRAKLYNSHHVKEDIRLFYVITLVSIETPSNFRKVGSSASCILGTYLPTLLTTCNHLDFKPWH
jgi:hemerythrin superfamily protein